LVHDSNLYLAKITQNLFQTELILYKHLSGFATLELTKDPGGLQLVDNAAGPVVAQ